MQLQDIASLPPETEIFIEGEDGKNQKILYFNVFRGAKRLIITCEETQELEKLKSDKQELQEELGDAEDTIRSLERQIKYLEETIEDLENNP